MCGILMCTAAGVILAAAMPVKSAELPKEDTYDTTSRIQEQATTSLVPKPSSHLPMNLVGTQLSNPPGGMFDKTSFRCVGSNVIINGKLSATTFCEASIRTAINF
jgi:hypothetical protein